MNGEKLTSLLGLAHRAGFIACGAMQIENAVISGRCKLLLVAADTATQTKKRIELMAKQTGTPTLETLTKMQLGTAVGKSPKAALAVTDIGFAGAIKRLV
jgi:ribosomal protein L7Ae-like RNA K-turn-binding protein